MYNVKALFLYDKLILKTFQKMIDQLYDAISKIFKIRLLFKYVCIE